MKDEIIDVILQDCEIPAYWLNALRFLVLGSDTNETIDLDKETQ